MPSLFSIATAVAVINGAGSIDRASPANGGLRYKDLTYSVREIQEGSGIGGAPPYCAEPNEDLLMIVYSVRSSSGQDISGPAVPRLQIVSPEGTVHQPNARYTQAITNKIAPPLTFRQGKLPAFGEVMLVDVFVTPRAPGGTAPKSASIIHGGWQLKTGRPGTEQINLPNPGNAEVLECPRDRSLSALRPNQSR